ncbi:MAG: hypothetical protein AAF556_07625, partial [Pseudomonadota bacterium]
DGDTGNLGTHSTENGNHKNGTEAAATAVAATTAATTAAATAATTMVRGVGDWRSDRDKPQEPEIAPTTTPVLGRGR